MRIYITVSSGSTTERTFQIGDTISTLKCMHSTESGKISEEYDLYYNNEKLPIDMTLGPEYDGARFYLVNRQFYISPEEYKTMKKRRKKGRFAGKGREKCTIL